MSVSYGKGPKGVATKLHAEIIRMLGMCESCGRSYGVQLQCSHIQGRKNSATRTALFNAHCLCASCHRIFTDKPLDFHKFVSSTWAKEYEDSLIELSRKGTKVDWLARVKWLRNIKKELEAGLSIEEARQRDYEEMEGIKL